MPVRLTRFSLVVAAALVLQGRLASAAVVNVVELSVSEIEAGLNTGKFTAADLMQSYLSRIQQFNPSYNAFTYLNPNAVAQAAAADATLKANGGVVPANKPMFGVPVVIKDSMNIGGVRTTSGYSGFTKENGGADMIPLADSPIVARLKAAGAIILGKTNLPSFARSGSNANTSYLGPTYNSYNRGIIPGGSSSGTATAVSGGFAPIGTAEETGGSIQNPAGAQALVGVKPTFGLVPTTGGTPLNGSTRDVFGVNSLTVTDAANFMSVIAGPDASDKNSTVSTGKPALGYASTLSTTALAGKRFGLFSPNFKNVTLSTETQQLYNKNVAILQAQGATVVTDPFAGTNFTSLAATFSSLSGANTPNDLQQFLKTMDPTKSPTSIGAFKTATGIDLLAENGPLLGSYAGTPGLADSVKTPDVSRDDLVAQFMQGRATMIAAYRKVMADFNLDGFFFPQEFREPGALVGGSYGNTTVSEINLLGTPQVNLPGGYYASGAPFSMAFLGDMWTESSLLNYAYDFEQATQYRFAPTLVPEPTALALIAAAGFGLARRRRRPIDSAV